MLLCRTVGSSITASSATFNRFTSPRRRALSDQLVIVGVGADPEPDEAIGRLDGQGAVVVSDSRGPIAANFLEPE